jgi:putative two-component system response regulator
MEARDPYTRGHSTRVGDLAKSFAEFLGFGNREQEIMRKAGILHDIGKIGVTTDLLCKEGKLNCDELEAIKRHTIMGEEICRPLVSMKGILPAIRNHHERWDGKGYPQGLQGTAIPLSARIFAVVDVWDALTSRRPYRYAWSEQQALEYILRESGRHFDPEVVKAFISKL